MRCATPSEPKFPGETPEKVVRSTATGLHARLLRHPACSQGSGVRADRACTGYREAPLLLMAVPKAVMDLYRMH